MPLSRAVADDGPSYAALLIQEFFDAGSLHNRCPGRAGSGK
jgi:hypothetical protein